MSVIVADGKTGYSEQNTPAKPKETPKKAAKQESKKEK